MQRIGTRFAKLGIVKNVLRLFGVAQILRFLISLAKATEAATRHALRDAALCRATLPGSALCCVATMLLQAGSATARPSPALSYQPAMPAPAHMSLSSLDAVWGG